MQVNRVIPARGLRCVRELIESFEADRLALTALTMKVRDGSYWRLSYGEMQEHVAPWAKPCSRSVSAGETASA